MTINEIQKAAERVAKIKAQAEKLSTPLADAQAELEAAQEAEAARRAERGAVYDREFAGGWHERADEAAHSGDDARERFYEALSSEPWFAAYVEFRAARHKRRHVLDEAQRAQRAVQEVVTVPEQRFYPAAILNDIESHVEEMAAENAAEFAEELRKTRDEFLESKD
ncbi:MULTISPECIES: hypothetical protein [unclassified Streptomyces]|uniref:hypothetical protein n=1 Tax=unclassified Streptomyces TaxID=2593676 RepID=UPI000823E5BD|nr:MULTISPECIES: hypothetical protein [unclassified Streptomyces]MYT98330.1 hypothetical protein [Streptomyces sp. SID8350]SCK28633.1 hypothetical protein YUWDRAFT_02116 [Streptomyces sp. AmelKG-D3]